MAKLIKSVTAAYIPADPGSPGKPATIGHAGYWVLEPSSLCSYVDVKIPGASESEKAGSDAVLPTYYAVGEYRCVKTYTPVYYPPEAPSAGVPYEAPTPAQVKVSLNVGWNSYASSIGKLDAGSYFEFSIKPGTTGALLAVGRAGKERAPIESFTHGVMTDVYAISVYEGGVAGTTLGVNTINKKIRIGRLVDGRIVYSVDNAFHISAAAGYLPSEELFVYGMLYSGYDEVSSSAFVAGNLLREVAVSLSGKGGVAAGLPPSARLTGRGGLIASIYPTALLVGNGSLSAAVQRTQTIEPTLSGRGQLIGFADVGGRGYGVLPLASSLGGDTDYGQGRGELSYLLSGLSNGQSGYVPAEVTRGYVNLPFFVGSARGVDIGIGIATASLPPAVGIAGDYSYGFGSGALSKYVSAGYGGFVPDDAMVLISQLNTGTPFDPQIDLLLVLNSAGELTSALAMTREQALALLSVLQHASVFSALGVYKLNTISSSAGLSVSAFSAEGRADLYEDGIVWVVNLDGSASVQYERFGFNSFFQRGSDYYGVANDGIYKLSGSTDDGTPIEAMIDLAKTNLGSQYEKSVPNIYVSAASDRALVLEVTANGTTHTYRARSSSKSLDKHRVDIGRGLRDVYWELRVKNEGGSDFDLAGLEVMPSSSKRRI